MKLDISRLEHRYLDPGDDTLSKAERLVPDGMIAEINPVFLKIVHKQDKPLNLGCNTTLLLMLGFPALALFAKAFGALLLMGPENHPFLFGMNLLLISLLLLATLYGLTHALRLYFHPCLYLNRRDGTVTGAEVHGFRFRRWKTISWCESGAALVRWTVKYKSATIRNAQLRLYETIPAADTDPWILLHAGGFAEEECNALWSFLVAYMKHGPEALPAVRLARRESTPSERRLGVACDMFASLLDERGAFKHPAFWLLLPFLAVSALLTYFPSTLGRWIQRRTPLREPPAGLKARLVYPSSAVSPYSTVEPARSPNVFEGPWGTLLSGLHAGLVGLSFLLYAALGGGLLWVML